MKIAIFLHGTTIMQKGAEGLSREERAKQVVDNEVSVHDYANYIPVDSAVDKLNKWINQGAEIVYLSSHESEGDVAKDKTVLNKYNFPVGPIYFRRSGETYAHLVENVLPDILIEDDCESIGGEIEMCYPNIKPEIKEKIKHIIVKEFQGIDHLPDNLDELDS
ncbi:MAG: hypothetical protein UU67_C0008G0024 [Candidatus Daviesbacteria bacterium GW2011_GWB1_41_5]|uniref:Phosphoglycerate mutase n=1 Tax=Candidatus Daviesbacteria bacterium GW2011_GWB1_41_5 TaxID=1618429 RepID=A0A0G0WPU5_9BACT|nr:MAG: hypothetical protein UU67_C0008G0024 [Candidatus Daviesbacteria bacterium GW2011_GWB1_41_5]